jgi:uncharacterized Zn finger protein
LYRCHKNGQKEIPTSVGIFCYNERMEPIATFITPENLEKLASRSNFRYGKQIAEDGEVNFTKVNRFNLEARVKHGNHEARGVKIESTVKGLRWKCTCTSKKGFFCQHCVAVGLAANPEKPSDE